MLAGSAERPWLLALVFLLNAAPALAEDTAELELFVFRGTAPAPGITLRITGEAEALGETDADGGLLTRLPSGRRSIELWDAAQRVAALDLLTDAGEVVQILVTLRSGAAPKIRIESSGRAAQSGSKTMSAEQEAPETQAAAQPPGALGGRVSSAEDGRPVAGARIYFTGIEAHLSTDDEGRFRVELPSGSYAVSVIHRAFETQTLDHIRVIPEREVALDIALTPAGVELREYVVTAPYVEGSVASILEQQRQATSVTEVLGAEQMSATGDSDAAGALQRVTGLTIEGGKFVLVRGQPSRYTLTLWNGAPLPSPEPLKRVVPLDLFPTGVLSNIEVEKGYSPARPGSFGAGLVNLNTRGVPDRPFLQLRLSTGYNSESTFRTGLGYRGGKWDAFGFDDGTRAMPGAVRRATRNGDISLQSLPPEERESLGREFRNIYRLRSHTLPPDGSISIAGGGSLSVPGDGRLGAVASLKWSHSWRRQRRKQRSFSLNGDTLQLRDDQIEQRSDRNADLGALLTVEGAWDTQRISSNTLWVHKTQQRSQLTTGRRTVSDVVDIRTFNLGYIERELVAEQLTGEHRFGPLTLAWNGMFAEARRDAPDRREYGYLKAPSQEQFFVRAEAGASRRFNRVRDRVWSFGGDLKLTLLPAERFWLTVDARVGGAFRFKDRASVVSTYVWEPDDEVVDLTETNPEVTFDPALTGEGLFLKDFSFIGADDYNGSTDVFGYFALVDLHFGDYARLVTGVRVEHAEMEVLTFQAASDDRETEAGGFQTVDALPAASLTVFLSKEMQLRFAASQTLARPEMNELSPAAFFDPDTGEEFIGNPNLDPAKILGVDLRWEWYPSGTESLSAGVFYKAYDDPLERTFVQRAGTVSVATFQNAKKAQVVGVEAGGRIELGHLRDWWGGPTLLERLYLQSNVAVLWSEVTLESQGSATDDQRPLDGQADFIFNLQGGYDGQEHDFTVALNVVGKRLHRAGVLGQQNVFRQPLPRLDATWRWALTEQFSVSLAGRNLAHPEVRLTQGGRTWRSYREGLEIAIGLSGNLH